MTQLIYDATFEGLLTAIFEAYERKIDHARIIKAGTELKDIFADSLTIISDPVKASRVWKGLKSKLSPPTTHSFYSCFLSELPLIEDTMLTFARHVFLSAQNIEKDFGHEATLTIAKTGRIVHREKHRMEAFVRFQRTTDGLFFSTIEPDFNVLPLIRKHFADRYADQRWLIYDVKRKYGLYYDLERVDTVSVDIGEKQNLENGYSFSLDESEGLYQHLWQQYFKSVNIASRKNMKLHIRHMPLRYWKYLVEKQPAVG